MNTVKEIDAQPLCISGVLPNLCMEADLMPARTEGGTGALVSWAGKLWCVTYVSHKKDTGAGTGLFEIQEDLTLRKRPESRVGTYANRLIHRQSNQLFIGPHAIDAKGNVRNIESLVDYRLTATMEHLEDPENKVYMLGMEGELFEVDVHDLGIRQIADLKKELNLPKSQPHFKGAFTAQGRLIVTNNTYSEPEFLGRREAGRLAEWDGKRWTIISKASFNEAHGRKNFGSVVYATGWDRASAIMMVLVEGEWKTYRLPKASQNFDHYCQTEWPRVREVEHERLLMNCHGLFYEMAPHAYGGQVWGVRPICTHLRVVPDFCSYRGLLVLGGDQNTPGHDANLLGGNSQANMWFGNIDELWNWGKPQGWGGPWWEENVEAEVPSDPYLMTGFDKKTLHLHHDADKAMDFLVEVDYLGTGNWKTYQTIQVASGGYEFHVFPDGYSAHWVRVTAKESCRATAYFMYR